MRPIRVVIVDDHQIVRTGLSALLGKHEDLHMVGMVDSGEEALRVIPEVEPDVALVDYRLPGISGIELCEMMRAREWNVKVLILTTFLEDGIIEGAIKAGASGYLHKDIEGRELALAIRSAAKGQGVLDPKVAGRVMGWAKKRRRNDQQALSVRETDVLRLVAQGEATKSIARKLGLTENSVKTYLARAMSKLNCHTRSQAAALAAKWGLL